MGQEAFFDPRPGGEYRVKVVNETAVGEFVEVEPPRRLVFTWGWDPGMVVGVPPGSSTVEIDLAPEGDGTVVRFRHSARTPCSATATAGTTTCRGSRQPRREATRAAIRGWMEE
jgi:uncharacterized protein YndB with AHSA1/START domain